MKRRPLYPSSYTPALEFGAFASHTRPSTIIVSLHFHLPIRHCFFCFSFVDKSLDSSNRLYHSGGLYHPGHLSDNTRPFVFSIFSFVYAALCSILLIFSLHDSPFDIWPLFSFQFSADRLRRIDTTRSYFAIHSP